jgi:negative regulator of sigma E activity
MAQESLSALLDGECSPAELDRILDELHRSPELKASYSRLCLAREAGEGTRIARQQRCICEGVMARVAVEPMLDAGPRVVDLDARRRWMTLKPMTGLAMAQVSAPALAPVANPVSRRRGELLAVAMTPEQAEQRAELDELLLRHSGAMAEQGVGGPLRYARVAAHARPAVLRADSAGTEVR